MSYLKICFLACFLCVAGLMAQTPKEILKKASEVLKSRKEMTQNLRYVSYAGPASGEVMENYTGFLVKKGDITYYRIKATEFIGFPDYSVKISHDEKAIQIQKAGKLPSLIDLETYLEVFHVRIVKSDDREWICELVPKKVSQLAFGKARINISKKEYAVTKQVLFLSGVVEHNNDLVQPRLEIFTSERKLQPQDAKLIDRKTYFSGSGNNLKVSKKFAQYKFYKT